MLNHNKDAFYHWAMASTSQIAGLYILQNKETHFDKIVISKTWIQQRWALKLTSNLPQQQRRGEENRPGRRTGNSPPPWKWAWFEGIDAGQRHKEAGRMTPISWFNMWSSSEHLFSNNHSFKRMSASPSLFSIQSKHLKGQLGPPLNHK